MHPAATPDRAADAVTALLGRVRRLELVGRRNVAGFRRGSYRTALRGEGLIFHESRKYVPGESARRIDWNITARVGEPHVRVHEEERQRNVVVALDVSPSMHVGYGAKSKLEAAVEVAATLAVAATEADDRLGYTIFADRVLARGRPRAGRTQLFRTLRAFLDHVEPWGREVTVSDPRAAIHDIESGQRERLVVFLVSDFIDHDLPRDLKYLRPRHDVTLVHVFDPFERLELPELVLSGYSPEADRGTTPFTPGGARSLAGIEETLRRECTANRLGYLPLAADDSVALALGSHFHRRRRGR